MYAPISSAILLIGVHGVDDERDIGCVLAPRAGRLLVLHDRKRPDRCGPRGQAAIREVALDAPHRGLAERRGRLEHRLPVSRASALGIDQHGKTRLPGISPMLSSAAMRSPVTAWS